VALGLREGVAVANASGQRARFSPGGCRRFVLVSPDTGPLDARGVAEGGVGVPVSLVCPPQPSARPTSRGPTPLCVLPRPSSTPPAASRRLNSPKSPAG